ncbi:MAG TPA: hypothetical protein VG326_14555 [Tepidisphaeraceae bacterium]|jgi:hypothetical protein|nr:hypothetical protein [Tepidisphaeraceae bacterium]
MPTEKSTTSPIVLIVAWLVVGLPGAWGIEQTLFKSFDLFRAHSPAAQATPTGQLPPQR